MRTQLRNCMWCAGVGAGAVLLYPEGACAGAGAVEENMGAGAGAGAVLEHTLSEDTGTGAVIK